MEEFFTRKILLPWKKRPWQEDCYTRSDMHDAPIMTVIYDDKSNHYKLYYYDANTMHKVLAGSLEECKKLGDLKAKEMGYRCLEDKYLVML